MHSLFKGVFLFGLMVLASCTPAAPKCQREPSVEEVKKAQRALADFAVNLYKNTTTDPEHKDRNEAISPISIALALAMLENGASGQTRDRLQQQLLDQHGSSEEMLQVYRAVEKHLQKGTGKTHVRIANAIFHDKDIHLKQQYEESTKDCLEANVEQTDFQENVDESRQKINDWIAEKTSHKIRKLADKVHLNKATKVVLVNALYFKADWERQFNKQATKKQSFYRNGREEERQDVNMMKVQGQFRHTSDDRLDAVELRYAQGELAMYVLIPKQRDGLRELERRLNGDELRRILGRMQQKNIEIQLPKFGVRSHLDLKQALIRMGLENIFDDRADFSRMTDEKLKVTEAAHEGYIQIDEYGTEGSASTVEVAENKAAVLPAEGQIKADHPFLYTIVHARTGAVVFIGKVNEVHEKADE